jgi:hypothetical protein
MYAAVEARSSSAVFSSSSLGEISRVARANRSQLVLSSGAEAATQPSSSAALR